MTCTTSIRRWIWLAPVGLVLAIAPAACSSSSGASNPTTAEGGGGGGGGGGGDGGVGTAGDPLPAGTFLYTRKVSASAHHLIAHDLATGAERTVTDLRSDGSQGWAIAGYSISPDRTKIAIASLFGPTAEDNLYVNAAPRVWVFNTAGADFVRTTPVFKTSGARIDIRNPAFSSDGKQVYYGYAEADVTGAGVTRTWRVPADGSALPDLLDIPSQCSTGSIPAVNPATGAVMLVQATCASKADEGFYFFTANQQPTQQVLAFGDLVSNYDQPRWAADGSLFVFSARQAGVYSLFGYVPAQKKLAVIVSGSATRSIEGGAVSPDGNYVVYCASEGDAKNIRVLDLTVDPAVDKAITTDGVSCNPAF